MERQAIVPADTTGAIRPWTSEREAFCGNTAAETAGRSFPLIIPAELRDRHWAGSRLARRTGNTRLDGMVHPALLVRCKDGIVRTIPGRVVFLGDPNDCPVGALAIYARTPG